MIEDPLKDIRVLDFTRYVSGPYATMLLADAGAEVIKVEPYGGEVSRSLSPIMHTDEGDVSTYFLRLNRGKKSVTLDVKSPEDRPRLEALIRSSDVLVENFRPGTLDAWGLGWERLQELNPELVYASISGFGHSTSPNREWPAFNLVAEAMAGVLSQLPTEGKRPRSVGLPIGDSNASLNVVNGILLALLRRVRSGTGSRVDIAMYDSMVSTNEWSIGVFSGTGTEVELGADVHPWFAPYGLFEASDAWLCICVATDGQWQKFCDVAGWNDLKAEPRLKIGTDRGANFNELIKPHLEEWLAKSTAEGVARELAEAGVPAAPVQRAKELLSDEQARAREMVIDFPVNASNSIKLAGNPVRIEPRSTATATGFSTAGEHNHEIFSDLDVSVAEGATAEKVSLS